MAIYGLTGGIGSGKSAASKIFESLGIQCVDSDIVAREVVEPGEPALTQIESHFAPLLESNECILLADGRLNRGVLRTLVFTNPEHKQWLEALLHPLIRARTIEQLNAATSAYVLLVSPLLFETGQDQLVDATIIVDVPESMQLMRAAARDTQSQAQVQKIIDAQISRDERLKRADFVIDNSSSLEHLKQQVLALHQSLLSAQQS